MPYIPSAAPLTRMADGTVKQVNPFTGTEVWTVPGRAHRPLSVHTVAPQPIDPSAEGAHCAFCEKRYLDTPPEKARLVRDATGAWDVLRGLGVEELTDTVAEFRASPTSSRSSPSTTGTPTTPTRCPSPPPGSRSATSPPPRGARTS